MFVATQTPTGSYPGGGPPLLLLMLLLFILFYFMVLRPEKKRQKEHAEMISNLKKNDEVVTSSGIHGTIVGIKDNTFILRIDEGTKIEINKNAIAYVKKQR